MVVVTVVMVVATEAAMADHARVAMVAGATGLVGQEILAALLADKSYSAVHAVGRRPLALKHRKFTSHVVDFAALSALPKVDDCFIALGTTIKVAGNLAASSSLQAAATLCAS